MFNIWILAYLTRGFHQTDSLNKLNKMSEMFTFNKYWTIKLGIVAYLI